MGPEGFEPELLRSFVSSRYSLDRGKGDAEYNAVDFDFIELCRVWGDLSDVVKVEIMSLVRGVADG